MSLFSPEMDIWECGSLPIYMVSHIFTLKRRLPHKQTNTGLVLFVCLFVCLFVILLSGLQQVNTYAGQGWHLFGMPGVPNKQPTA